MTGHRFDAPERALLVRWRDALRDSALDSTAKLVGFVLSTYFRGDGSGAFPSRKTIAAGAGLRSEGAVYKAARRLRDAGFLTIKESHGRRSTVYTPTMPTVHPRARLEPDTAVNGSDGNRASDDAQPFTRALPTVHPHAHESGESELKAVRAREPGADDLTDAGRAWLDNVGVQYALDESSFVEDAVKVLKVSESVAERLRQELLDRRTAAT